MAYAFKHVTVHIFDIHPALLLLQEPARQYYQDPFKFLQSADEYRKIYIGAQPIETNSFSFGSLPASELDKSHFWEPFSRISKKDGQPDFWTLQMPFIGKYKKSGITVEHKLAGVKITVSPLIYLSAIGWSVNLRIDLKGDIKKADLIDFMDWISRGTQKSFSFKIGAETMDRKECLRFFNSRILEEVYQKANAPLRGMKIINQVIVSINSYEGDVIPYIDMPAFEQALMRSILFGNNIDVLQLESEKQKRPLATTHITTSATNFALTNFEQGSLIFLQREAKVRKPVNRRNKRKVMCFVENCKNCTMMAYLLSEFYSKTANSNGAGDLANLRTSIPQTVKQIPDYYGSAFCKNLFLQNSRFRDLK
jgi:hypothetical protein